MVSRAVRGADTVTTYAAARVLANRSGALTLQTENHGCLRSRRYASTGLEGQLKRCAQLQLPLEESLRELDVVQVGIARLHVDAHAVNAVADDDVLRNDVLKGLPSVGRRKHGAGDVLPINFDADAFA